MAVSKKQKNSSNWAIVMILAIFLAALFWFFFIQRTSTSKPSIRYTAFGIAIPSDYSLHGIDVSRYQSQIDWAAVSRMRVDSIQLDFCFIKATEGKKYTDPFFKTNWKQITKTSLIRGAYHYYNPNEDGSAQAAHFIDQVDLRIGDLPPVLDIEILGAASPKKLVIGVRQWLDRVEAHYGVKPILYSGVQFYKDYLANHFAAYPLWIAHYYQPSSPRTSHAWMFWQHSDRGRVNGIESEVDFNVFKGTRAAFDSLRIR